MLVQPLIFQAFLLLVDAGGKVVTREELFDRLWGNATVGDDSLNRLIAGVREIAATTGPGLFEVETIPRTGYRMTGEVVTSDTSAEQADGRHSLVGRRTVAAGLATACLAGAGVWSYRRGSAHRNFNELIRRGEEALHYGAAEQDAVSHLEDAVALRPEDARAWGLLAYARCNRTSDQDNPGPALEQAQRAATTALAIDPQEANARIANVILQRSVLDLTQTETALRGILRSSPRNAFAMKRLWELLQSTGRSQAAWNLNQQAVAMYPLAAAYQFPRAQFLWILGNNAEADRVIGLTYQRWPDHRFVRFARISIFAFTGRPRAALAMLDDDEQRPQTFDSDTVAIWRYSLTALSEPSRSANSQATRSIVDLARQKPALARPAVFMLSALGSVDEAFDIANDFLLYRQPTEQTAQRPTSKSVGWRFTPWLFIPPAKPLRLDPRFPALCEGMGLTEYWQKNRTGPDAFLMRA